MKFRITSGTVYELKSSKIVGKITTYIFEPSPAFYVFKGKEYPNPLIYSVSIDKHHLFKTYGAIEFFTLNHTPKAE